MSKKLKLRKKLIDKCQKLEKINLKLSEKSQLKSCWKLFPNVFVTQDYLKYARQILDKRQVKFKFKSLRSL